MCYRLTVYLGQQLKLLEQMTANNIARELTNLEKTYKKQQMKRKDKI